jgi:hypothetical protein
MVKEYPSTESVTFNITAIFDGQDHGRGWKDALKMGYEIAKLYLRISS